MTSHAAAGAPRHPGSPATNAAQNGSIAFWSGIVEPAHARLFIRERLFTGWGIRAFAAGQPRFNLIGYPVGTVWPHPNSLIAAGCRRFGFDKAALRIFSSMLEAAVSFEACRLSEAFAGSPRVGFGVPVGCPVACHPQPWATGDIPCLLGTVLGLVPHAYERRLGIERPILPPFLEREELRRLRVAGARVSSRFKRTDDHDHDRVDVLEVDGELAVNVNQDPDRAWRHYAAWPRATTGAP